MSEVTKDQSAEPIIRIDGVVRTFKQAGEPLNVLRGASLRVDGGELVALVEPIGSRQIDAVAYRGIAGKS